MDVRLPDGRILRNVPEGTTKAQIEAKLGGMSAAAPQPAAVAQAPAPTAPQLSGQDATSYMARRAIGGNILGLKQMGNLLRGSIGDAGFNPTGGASYTDELPIDKPTLRADVSSADARMRAEQDARVAQDAPLMNTTEGKFGNFIGSVVSGLPTLALGPGVPAAMAGGALLGAMQPVGTKDSRGANTAIGGAAGAAGGLIAKGIGRLIQPSQKVLPAVDKRAVETLAKHGVPLDAAQRTGSSALSSIKSGLRDNLVTRGAAMESAQKQQASFTRAVLRHIGSNADTADEAVMGEAYKRIGGEFNDILPRVSMRPSKGFDTALSQAEARAARVTTDSRVARIVADIRQHAAGNGGAIDGAFYNNIRSDLAALESEKGVAPIARGMRELMDNAFTQAAGKEDAGRLVLARRMWRNMRIIEGAIDTEGGGMISPAKLANAFGTKRNRSVGVYGMGDQSIASLARLAKAGKRLIPDKLPNSGTTARAVMQTAVPAAVGAAYGGITEGDWKGAAMYGLGGVAAPYMLQRAITSPAVGNYLRPAAQGAIRSNALRTLNQLPIAALSAPLVLSPQP